MTAEALVKDCSEKGFIYQLKEGVVIAIPPRFAILQMCLCEDFQGIRWQLGSNADTLACESLLVMN